MNAGLIERELGALIATPGVHECALVECGSGLVLYAAGGRERHQLWEAAVEYWRLHARVRSSFDSLDELRAIMVVHVKGRLVLLPCSKESDLVVACLADHKGVDWLHWQNAVRRLASQLQE